MAAPRRAGVTAGRGTDCGLAVTRPGRHQSGKPVIAGLWVSYLIVFLASGCTLVLEIVAGRILAP